MGKYFLKSHIGLAGNSKDYVHVAYIINEKNKSPDTTVILSSGDMFQGSAISNMTQGGVVVEAMNEIGFDAMTIGNHEFDWGIDKIAAYNDGDEKNGEADFPFLSCNIVYKSNNQLLSCKKTWIIIFHWVLQLLIYKSLKAGNVWFYIYMCMYIYIYYISRA